MVSRAARLTKKTALVVEANAQRIEELRAELDTLEETVDGYVHRLSDVTEALYANNEEGIVDTPTARKPCVCRCAI